MDEFKCPHTGRVFTNPDLYRQHLATWPSICEANGLNLDGTPKGSSQEENLEFSGYLEVVDSITFDGFTEDFPHADLLRQNGISKIEDVPTTLADLQKLEGIGKSKATDILKALAEVD